MGLVSTKRESTNRSQKKMNILMGLTDEDGVGYVTVRLKKTELRDGGVQ